MQVVFGDDIDYVYKPLSQEAQTGFYDRVSMLTIVKWYLTHPAKLWYMLRKDRPSWKRMLCLVPLFLIVTGAFQFPLSVLGNGFADNRKQLFCFSLCHDLLLGGALFLPPAACSSCLPPSRAKAPPDRSAGKKARGSRLSPAAGPENDDFSLFPPCVPPNPPRKPIAFTGKKVYNRG